MRLSLFSLTCVLVAFAGLAHATSAAEEREAELNQIQADFELADEFVHNLPKNGPVTFQTRLIFYANYKLATVGPCSEFGGPAPLPIDLNRLAKWTAWNSLGNKDPLQAKIDYIELLDECSPGWRGE